MSDDSFAWAQAQLAAVLGLPAEDIARSSRFADDLDADSIDLIEVVNKAEAAFGIEVPEDELYDIETVAEFVQLLDARRAG
ncbi:MAG: acyl carrier protein [Acidimicrobiales bacterium]